MTFRRAPVDKPVFHFVENGLLFFTHGLAKDIGVALAETREML